MNEQHSLILLAYRTNRQRFQYNILHYDSLIVVEEKHFKTGKGLSLELLCQDNIFYKSEEIISWLDEGNLSYLLNVDFLEAIYIRENS